MTQSDQLPDGLIAQLLEVLHRYRRGHGFEFRSPLNASSFCITATINHKFKCFYWFAQIFQSLAGFSKNYKLLLTRQSKIILTYESTKARHKLRDVVDTEAY